MKYLDLVGFIIAIHVAIAFVNSIGIFAVMKQPSSELFDSIGQNKLKDTEYITIEIANQDPSVGDYVKALFYFIGTFALGIVWIPYTLKMIGLTYPYTFFISLLGYFIYIVGWIQLINKDSFKSKQ